MDFEIIKDKIHTINIEKQIYETEEQFMDKVVFYLCCLDYGLSHEKSETLCNIYKNKRKYRVCYPIEIETLVENIKNQYNIEI